MIKPLVLAALLKQIQHEQSNAQAYRAVALYFGGLSLRGLEAFMSRQAREERGHAERLIAHAVDRGGQVELGAIPAYRSDFASPLEAARAVRDMERKTTESIHRLYELARKEGDHALEVRLHWFITEQVEEEAWSDELMATMERVHDQPGQLSMLDHQWGNRAKRK